MILVASPLFCEPPLYTAIRDLLFMLMSTQKGMVLMMLLVTWPVWVRLRNNYTGSVKFIIIYLPKVIYLPYPYLLNLVTHLS